MLTKHQEKRPNLNLFTSIFRTTITNHKLLRIFQIKSGDVIIDVMINIKPIITTKILTKSEINESVSNLP